MQLIADTVELRRLHAAGIGFIHNPDGQVLHRADCDHVLRMSARRKLYFTDSDEARAYLSADGRRRWESCPHCHRPTISVSSASEASSPGPTISAEYVPFEPKTDAQRALKQHLREQLSRLFVPSGQLLLASYHGALPPRADVENVLLYNVGGAALNRALRSGVRFELARANASTPAYRYGVVPAGLSFDHWREERTLLALDHIRPASIRLVDVWWALRLHRSGLPSGSFAGYFALRVRVAGPSPLGVELVKGLIDGIVAGLEHMPAGSAPPAATRYASELDVAHHDFLGALTDPAGTILGTNAALLCERWAPADDRLVAAEIVYEHGHEWRVAASASAVRPV
jgi:hypothetical protein